MTKKAVLNYIGRVVNLIENSMYSISHKLDFENTLPGRNIDEILMNHEDAKKLDDAVEYLKKNRGVKSKNLTLSEKEKITVSIS